MIVVENVLTLDNKRTTLTFPSSEDEVIDGSELTLLPALIDPHVHFRIPGGAHKEDWETGSQAAINGGVTTVFDMPNTIPPGVSVERLIEKKRVIQQQLANVGIPLRYGLFLGADDHHLHEIEKMGEESIGLKIFMGCSTYDLCLDSSALEEAFEKAARANKVVAVHAEDEELIREGKRRYSDVSDPSVHSHIRSRRAAIVATERAIELAMKTGATLYLLHISTKEELLLAKAAKKLGCKVFVEVTPHHLFLNEESYETLGTLVQVNPPLRTKEDNEALWEGIHEGIVDTVGSDHAPHLMREKREGYGKAPSGVCGVETLLPLLLNAVYEKRLSLTRLVELTRRNIEKIFSLPDQEDGVLVNLNLENQVDNNELKTKCRWSPFHGMLLRGWPIYTSCRGKLFEAAGFRANHLLNPRRLGGKLRREETLHEHRDNKVQVFL